MFMKINDCSKKYDTFDEQQKCTDTKKILNNYSKCAQRYASKSSPSMLNNSKNSKNSKKK